jgi:mono/diheme cytochrome c family protein
VIRVVRQHSFSRSARSLSSIAIATCLFIVGCDRRIDDFARPSAIEALAMRASSRDPLTETRSRGRTVFKHYCAICHGDSGKGDGFNSSSLETAPRDFSNAEFWQRSTDENLLVAISKGGPAVGKSVLMPAWGRTLTARQLDDVIFYLGTLCSPSEPSSLTEP